MLPQVLAVEATETETSGVFEGVLQLDTRAPLGDYVVTADGDDMAAELTVNVDEYVLPKFEVTSYRSHFPNGGPAPSRWLPSTRVRRSVCQDLSVKRQLHLLVHPPPAWLSVHPTTRMSVCLCLSVRRPVSRPSVYLSARPYRCALSGSVETLPERPPPSCPHAGLL